MLILEIAVGVFLGGLFLRWATTPSKDPDEEMWEMITKDEIELKYGKK